MHPLAGAWIANIAKSRRHPNHLFQSSTMRFDVAENLVVLAYAGVNMAGKHESATQTLQVDGVEHPIEQAPGVVSRCSWIGSRTLETVGKKDGVVLGQGTYSVSEDGGTLTATISGIDGQGAPFEQVIVFDRDDAEAAH
jgi:hypothetical protein